MKLQSNISKVGYLAAAIYGAVTIYHYWIQYQDTSQFILNFAVACLIASVSFLYDGQKKQQATLDAVEDYLGDKEGVNYG